MFYEKDNGGYRSLADGIEMKPLVHGKKTLLCEFRLAKGSVLPLHDHPHEQTGYLVSGKMRFDIEGDAFEANPGDSWSIGGGTVHAAEVLEDAVVIEVFSPVRNEYL